MRNILLLLTILLALGCRNLNNHGGNGQARAMKVEPGWDSVGGGITGNVNAMAIYKGNLYVGGRIDSAGGVPVQGIAMWDGNQWHPVDKGIRGVVNTLTVYNNELYAGGFFDNAGGKPYSYVAKWNGAKWSDVDTLMDVITMAVLDNKLYAAGFNDSSEERTTHTIGCWNGRDWESLANPDKKWEIKSLCAFKGNIYAGGKMGSDSSLIILGKYGWNVVERHFPYEIDAMLVHDSELVMAGSDVEGNGSSHIIKWNGKRWSMPGTVLKGPILSLAVYNDKLYAGGAFARIDDEYAGCLAVLNDTVWQPLGGGVNLNTIALEKRCSVTESNMVEYIDTTPNTQGIVYRDTLTAHIFINAMIEYKGALYIGGKFDIAGGVQAQNIARYKEPVATSAK